VTRFKAELLRFAQAAGQELSEERLRALCSYLSNYAETDLIDALHQHAHQSPWIPAPAELIELIEGSAKDRAALAWSHVLATIAGTDRRVLSAPRAMHHAVRACGGWGAIGHANTRFELPILRKQFIAAYIAADRRDAIAHRRTTAPGENLEPRGGVVEGVSKRLSGR